MKKYKDNNQLLKYIEKFELDNWLNEELLNSCEFHVFSKNELICTLGNKPINFYILLEGNIKVFTSSSEGKILSLRIFKPLTNLGDIELITGTNYRCNVEALNECICISIPMNIIRDIGLNNNIFLRFLCSDLCCKFDDIASVSSNNLLYPLRNRLVSYMLDYMDKDNIITFPFSNKDLAELLGTSYRHLSRSLSELEDLGLIKMNKNIIHVIDKHNLEKFYVDIYPHKN